MFTRGTPNKSTETGLPSVSFVLRFSLKATMETLLLSIKHSYLMLPLSLKNKKLVHYLPRTLPPLFFMATKHADGEHV